MFCKCSNIINLCSYTLFALRSVSEVIFPVVKFVPEMPEEPKSISTPSSSFPSDARDVKLDSTSVDNKTKRPMNAFFIWSTFQRKQSHGKTLAAHQNDVCRSFGATWRQLSKEEKQPFYNEAKRLAAEHKRLNPDYKYNPRRKSAQQTAQSISKRTSQQSKNQSHSITSLEPAHPCLKEHHRRIVAVAPGASTLLHIQQRPSPLVGATTTSLHNNVGVLSTRKVDVAYDTVSKINPNNTFGGDNSFTPFPDWSYPGTYSDRGTPAEFASNVLGTYNISDNDNDASEWELTHQTL